MCGLQTILEFDLQFIPQPYRSEVVGRLAELNGGQAAQSPEYLRAERRMHFMLAVEMRVRGWLDAIRDFCNSAWGSLPPEVEQAIENWVRGETPPEDVELVAWERNL